MMDHSRIPDYYGLLGVGADASCDEIRRAFLRRAKLCHPDVNPSVRAREAFLGLSEAYHVLRHEGRRRGFDADRHEEALYDRSLRRRRQGLAAACALIGLIGATAFVLDNVETTDPVSARPVVGVELSASAMPAVDASTTATPLVYAANGASDPRHSDPEPAVQSAVSFDVWGPWQADVSPEKMPLVTAPDIVEEPQVAASARSIPAAPAIPVARPALVTRAVAPRTRAFIARIVSHARVYKAHARVRAAVQTAAARTRHRVARRVVKRRYASD